MSFGSSTSCWASSVRTTASPYRLSVKGNTNRRGNRATARSTHMRVRSGSRAGSGVGAVTAGTLGDGAEGSVGLTDSMGAVQLSPFGVNVQRWARRHVPPRPPRPPAPRRSILGATCSTLLETSGLHQGALQARSDAAAGPVTLRGCHHAASGPAFQTRGGVAAAPGPSARRLHVGIPDGGVRLPHSVAETFLHARAIC